MRVWVCAWGSETEPEIDAVYDDLSIGERLRLGCMYPYVQVCGLDVIRGSPVLRWIDTGEG